MEPGIARDYGTELFVLRRDGFAALAGGASPGLLVTRPFVVAAGGGLYVNAEVEPGGSIRASVLGPDSRELVGLEQSRCAELTATSIRAPLRWSGAAGLSALAARPVRLAFHIKNAKLYSFWIE
ncbi:MAG: hypothetical protein DMG07_18625 [Acidobacteria bacterium]|nr:MAG: hypothetical protein DMG07_18625 [Acidobacteriota bacterium]